MISLLSLFVLKVAVSSSLTAAKSTRIVGGDFAGDGQFPYQAAILSPTGSVICGGVILSEKFILTAGHCVDREVAFLRVMVGSNTIDPPGPIYKVEAKYRHEDYVKNRLDIALLELKVPLEFGNNVKAIEIYTGKFHAGMEVTISGWGGSGDRITNNLKYAKVQIGGTEVCPKTPDSVFSYEYVLCLSHENGTGFCGVDTGGPAVYENKLIGEGIYVNGKCGTKSDGYQNVVYFRDWINKIAFKE